MLNNEIIGNRIPNQYFFTKGNGSTDFGPGDDPWETGSYDIALLDAEIENFNMLAYTSVIPATAVEIPIQEAKKFFINGSVLESIISSVNGYKGDTIVSGVGQIFVKDKSTNEIISGFASEYKKCYTKKFIPTIEAEITARDYISDSLYNIVERRYDMRCVEVYNIKIVTTSLNIKQKFGTCLVAIGFVNYILPVFQSNNICYRYYN